MGRPRFFCPQFQLEQTITELTDPHELHHACHVLRLKAGDEIELFNGQGEQAEGRIQSITPSKMLVSLTAAHNVKTAGIPLILACAIPKKGKFETIIEKTTELNVQQIIPLKTQRTQIPLDTDRLQRKWQRFHNVAVNASKQCQRATVPVIHPVTSLEDALNLVRQRAKILMPSLIGQRQPLIQALNNHTAGQPLCFFIGPEGDFTHEEYQHAHSEGAVPVSLGATVLKVETAAISAVACARFFYDV